MIPSSVFFIFIVFFTSVYFFSIFSNSVKLLTVFVYSSPEFVEHLMIIILNSLWVRLLISTLVCSSSGVLSFFFVWNVFLCLFILPNSLFISMYLVGHLAFMILEKWPSVGDI